MQQKSIYRDLARYYDVIYSWKDYEAEVEVIKSLINKYKKSKGKEVLETACGTGKHAAHLKKYYKVTATDLNAEMLKIARKNVKGVDFLSADMTQLQLGKEFDVVLCLFSSIGYVRTKSNLKKAIQGFARHLKPGGIVIIEPWFSRSSYQVGTPHMNVYGNDDIKIARGSVSKVRGNISIMDMNYLIAEKGKEVKHFVDRHELGMFEQKDMLALMKAAGLQAKFLKDGLMKDRGLYIGVK